MSRSSFGVALRANRALWIDTFPLSYRDVHKLLVDRGIDVSHEAIRAWCCEVGQRFANQIRRHRRPTGDKWHLDEVVVTINGKKYYLWRAVDTQGNVLDVLLQQHLKMDGESCYRLSFGSDIAADSLLTKAPNNLKTLFMLFQ